MEPIVPSVWITWRYYQAILDQNLWGGWVLTRCRGGQVRRAGQVRVTVLPGRQEGLELLRQIDRTRRAHRYQPAGSQPLELVDSWSP